MRNRSVVFVIRDKKILMEKLCYEGRTFYSIPGGGIEDGETPEQTAIRELKEECGLDGVIIRKLAEVYNHERTEYSFWVSVPKEQEAIKGYDPEEPVDDQPIKEVRWMNLNEMSEKDRAFMWRYGLLEIPEFCLCVRVITDALDAGENCRGDGEDRNKNGAGEQKLKKRKARVAE